MTEKKGVRRNRPSRNKKRRSFRKGRLITLLVLLLLFLAGIAAGGYYAVWYIDGILHDNKPATGINAPVYDSGKFRIAGYRNILIIGLDGSKNKPAADYCAIFSCDSRGANPPVVFQVPVSAVISGKDGKATGTLQQLYAGSGPLAVANALVTQYAIPVTDWITLDFTTLQRMVDSAGGVDLFVEKQLDYEDKYSDTSIHIASGFQHFDGKNALDYARFCRDDLSYDGRSKRQARLIREMWLKMFSLKLLMQPTEIYDIVKRCIDTDMSVLQLSVAFLDFRKAAPGKIVTLTMPGKYGTGGNNFSPDAGRTASFVFGTYYEKVSGKDKKE